MYNNQATQPPFRNYGEAKPQPTGYLANDICEVKVETLQQQLANTLDQLQNIHGRVDGIRYSLFGEGEPEMNKDAPMDSMQSIVARIRTQVALIGDKVTSISMRL